ncbi:alpha/beta fold hydrolase [Pseudoalteromonas 'SMAR']|uniref:alpha/beta fold hydrolase n=1 Tax=Pseudoalteromonas 'SMAR' TaxID=3416908 RepID=UPI003AF2DB6F
MLLTVSKSTPVYAHDTNNLSIELSGNGDTVIVFESGFAQGPGVWEEIITNLPKSVLAIRYHRAGNTPTGNQIEPIGLEHHIQDLKSLITQFASKKRLILVGHSYGGLVVTEFARRFPNSVDSLMLIDPAVKQQRLWFKASNAKAVAEEDALFATMLPPHLLAQLTKLNQTLDDAKPDVVPLPSNVKTILLTSMRVETKPIAFVETAEGKAIWLKLHQALFAKVTKGCHLKLNHVGHDIMRDDPDLVLNHLRALL